MHLSRVHSLVRSRTFWYYSICFFIAFFYAFYVANSAVFHSDWAAYYLFFDEVIKTGSMTTYYMPPTPALFQMVAYMFPMFLLFGMSFSTFYGVIFFQTLVTVMVFSILAKVLFPVKSKQFPKTALFVFGLTLVGPMLAIIDQVMFRKDMPLILLAIYFLYQAVGAAQTYSKKMIRVIVLVIVFLTIQAFGDPYVMYMILIPMIVANGVYFFLKKPRTRQPLLLAAIALMSIVLSFLIRWLVAQSVFHLYTGISSVSGPHKWWGSLISFAGDIDQLLPIASALRPSVGVLGLLTAGINLAVFLAILTAVVMTLRIAFRQSNQFMFYLATLPLMSSAIYILTAKPVAHMTRYHILTVTCIYIIVLYAIQHATFIKQRVRLVLYGILAVSLVINASVWLGAYADQLLHLEKYTQLEADTKLIDVLQQHNLTRGYGGYWEAANTTYFTKGALIIRPIVCRDGKLMPHYWFTFSQWYDSDPSVKRTFVYVDKNGETFTSGCMIADLRQQFGMEAESIELAENKMIYIWNYDIASRIDRKNIDEDQLFNATALSNRVRRRVQKNID